MCYSDDPLMDFMRHDRKQAQQLAQLPECDYCHEPIQSHYYLINDENICPKCMDDYFRVENE